MLHNVHIDGGRISTISRAMRAHLCMVADHADGSGCLLLHRARGQNRIVVVATDPQFAEHVQARGEFLVGEEVSCSKPLPRHLPRWISRFTIASRQRTLQHSFSEALLIPWATSAGDAWLGIMRKDARAEPSALPDPVLLEHLAAARRIYEGSLRRSLRQLEYHLSQAAQRLAEAETNPRGDGLLDAVAGTARWLFGASASYVAQPSQRGETFCFVASDRVFTSEFRRLELGPDEGIGGLARRERRPVRTTDYAGDPRLVRAPHLETLAEGFRSAACTPILIDDAVHGLVYVAQRRFRSFTDTDLGLLEHFGAEVAAVLKRDAGRRTQLDRIRRHERRAIADDLHDRVVGHLLEIGFLTRQVAQGGGDGGRGEAFSAICAAAELCLAELRRCIAERAGESGGVPAPVMNLLATCEALTRPSGLSLFMEVGAAIRPETVLRPALFDALAVIACEAIRNAYRHSGATEVRMRLCRDHAGIRLTVEDDGCGIAPGAFLGRPGHLGLVRIRGSVQGLAGRVTFGSSQLGGLLVDAWIPDALE